MWCRCPTFGLNGKTDARYSICLCTEANRKTALDGVGEHIGQITGEYGVFHTVPPRGAQQICMILFKQGHVPGVGKEKGCERFGEKHRFEQWNTRVYLKFHPRNCVPVGCGGNYNR